MEKNEKKRFVFLVCEILYREACYCVAMSRNVVDIAVLPKKLHNIGEAKMSAALQERIDSVDSEKYDAILLGYGLCNYGVRGLHHPILPLVIPKAHDCIALLMGSKERYREYFDDNPGTFFHSSGWIERDSADNTDEESISAILGINKTYEEYVEIYGEENAEFLVGVLGDGLQNYRKIAYIDSGLGNMACDYVFSMEYARSRGWEFERIMGDNRLMQRLLDGEWRDCDFLVVPPGNVIEPSYNHEIVKIISITKP
ncbi:MAG: DUF1638 domain-containing protein [Synergistaceae bacterium]|jgi:hypothetical protein|nr:DUF1638 domain-containing protein [Synergistaceae bacterium]